MGENVNIASLRRAALVLGLAWGASLHAIELPQPNAAAPAEVRSEILYIAELGQPADRLGRAGSTERAARLGSTAAYSMIDERTGRFLTLMLAQPMLPGAGVGNRVVDPAALASPLALQSRAAKLFGDWLAQHSADLQIKLSELGEPRVTLVAPEHIQIYIERRVDGVLVREAAITATIKHGNLILVGMSNWGSIDQPRTVQVSVNTARQTLAQRIAPLRSSAEWKAADLAYVPVAAASGGFAEATVPGLDYRLVHVLRPSFADPHARHEALIDAQTGELLLLTDTVHHIATPREVKGGVYPVSNDGVAPDGVERLNWPMPYTRVTVPGGTLVADVGGNLPQCVDGSITAGLRGQYVTINDNCGASSLTGTGELNFGGSSGTDCTTPGIGGPGNTHAARTGYFELNMIKEMGRGQLPLNTWLQGNLTANMNISNTCNATWNGSAVNFYRSGGGCGNTGEIAAVFDHEWGHGMDNNDGVPNVSNPGEGIADLYASLRLDDSCIGRNFTTTQCTGELAGGVYACTQCTGVRDIDWAKHITNAPFTLANADACPAGPGPCGGRVHCEGQTYSQAVWDLWNRDLTGGTFNLDKNVAREIATRLTFAGASGVQTWFACSNGTGGCTNPAGCGCTATAGYTQYLAADDDNGNLADGTPHMSAIHAAFTRHGVACNSVPVVDSGCADAPTEIPVVSTMVGNGTVDLSWTASEGASSYRVYRTDGVFGCDFGKILVGTVSGTSFIDVGLQNGREYYYSVMPTGSNNTCFSVSSACTTAIPTAGPKLTAVVAQASFTPQSGDGDTFVDNCETTDVSFPLSNAGTAALSNVRIVAASSPSHPDTVVVTALPLSVSNSLASCATENASLQINPGGLQQGDTLVLELTVLSDEQPNQPLLVRVQTQATESDLSAPGTQTFNFDSDESGWSVVQGTFVRSDASGGGAGTPASSHYMRSSMNADNQCDAVESPSLILSADSTLSMSTRYNIENVSGGTWFDRGHLAAFTLDDASTTVLTPSGGRAYNASGTAAFCGFGNVPGWAGAADTWAESTFNATALQTGTLADRLLRLRVRFGTDVSVTNYGLRFDAVTVTNARLQVADQQANQCIVLPLLVDGFESVP
jgi:hypothetical protein